MVKVESASVNGKDTSSVSTKPNTDLNTTAPSNIDPAPGKGLQSKVQPIARRNEFLVALHRTREESIDDLESMQAEFRNSKSQFDTTHRASIEDIDKDIREARTHLLKLEKRRNELQVTHVRQTLEMEAAYNSDRLALEANIRDADSLLRGAARRLTAQNKIAQPAPAQLPAKPQAPVNGSQPALNA
ncbi:MAG: hypothetical protein AAFR71_05580 [Pseudomonadota bacterium]